MKFRIAVGDVKRHEVEYGFNQVLGHSVLKLDQQVIRRKIRLFNEPLRETHLVELPEGEQLTVRIEKERKRLFGHKFRVFLNGRLYKVFERHLKPP